MLSTTFSRGLIFVAAFGAFGLVGCGSDDGSAGDEQDVTAGPAAGQFETFVGKDKQFYFHLLAANGEKVLQSEGYTTLAAAKKGIASVRKNGASEANYKLLQAKSGESYFNLVAGNNQVIGTSELYVTKTNADRGMNTVISLLGGNEPSRTAPSGAKFETFKGLDGKFYFHLRAGNGEIVLQSQGYKAKASAETGITSVNTNGTDATHYVVLEAQDGQFFFDLKAANGQIIGRSELYVSKTNAERGVETVVALIQSDSAEY